VRTIAIITLGLAALLSTASAAQAGTYENCGVYPGQFPERKGWDTFSFPTIGHVKVRRDTCKHGFGVARGIRRAWERRMKMCQFSPENRPENCDEVRFAKHVKTHGKRYACRYVQKPAKYDNPYVMAHCRRGSHRAKMDLGA
jgi:hypothetical protein